MKEILKRIHRPARRVFIMGWSVILAVLAASTVLYIGAGSLFDYYSAVEISEGLLASVRPISVAVCVSSLGVEYYSKQKKDSSD
ncbi:MAG: hypothetical protein IJ264_09590 [Clostridia bacterium]|nr:hypothetical protein [Clostridia bacterium]